MELEEAYDEIRALDAELIALSTDDIPRARNMQERTGARYPVLADPDHAVADAYGIFNLLDDGVAAPTTIILTSERIIAMQVGQDIGDRPSTASILHTLRQLKAGELEPAAAS